MLKHDYHTHNECNIIDGIFFDAISYLTWAINVQVFFHKFGKETFWVICGKFKTPKYINLWCIYILQNNVGILALLDEQCLLPGNKTDKTFLEKLNQTCKDHLHYESRGLRKNQSDRTLPHDTFRLKHYAGSVSLSFLFV